MARLLHIIVRNPKLERSFLSFCFNVTFKFITSSNITYNYYVAMCLNVGFLGFTSKVSVDRWQSN